MLAIASLEHGFYVDLQKNDDGNLEILLNENGRSNFDTIQEVRDAQGINEALYALLEDHLYNGWEMVPPEDIGALTAAPILSMRFCGTIMEESWRPAEFIGIPITRCGMKSRNSETD